MSSQMNRSGNVLRKKVGSQNEETVWVLDLYPNHTGIGPIFPDGRMHQPAGGDQRFLFPYCRESSAQSIPAECHKRPAFHRQDEHDT
jgi:hypothetical protein